MLNVSESSKVPMQSIVPRYPADVRPQHAAGRHNAISYNPFGTVPNNIEENYS